MSNTIFSRKQKVRVGQNSREDWKVSGKVSKYKKKEREKKVIWPQSMQLDLKSHDFLHIYCFHVQISIYFFYQKKWYYILTPSGISVWGQFCSTWIFSFIIIIHYTNIVRFTISQSNITKYLGIFSPLVDNMSYVDNWWW